MKDYVFQEFVCVDEKEPGILIAPALKGLFPDKKFGVVMPAGRDWPHLRNTDKTERVEISLRGTDEIIVSAFDKSSKPVRSCDGKIEKVIELRKDYLAKARGDIQSALESFQGLRTAHTRTHLPLSVDI